MDTASPLGNGMEGPARWSLRLFGSFELSVLPGGERVAPPGKRERVLLAYLALSPNYRQPRRKLVSLLWGDAADETTLDNLRNCLWNLRKALGDTEHRVVASEGDDIVLDVAAFDVDALEFRRLAAQSGRTELDAAAALYSGEFLDGLVIESEEFESWRRAEAARYRDQAIDVLTRLMTGCSECGETERAIDIGLRIIRLEPLHEAAVRRLMRHYGESGRRGVAIQLYRTLADTLRTELDAQPEAETRLVFAEIARGGEERTSAPAAADADRPPAGMARPSVASSGPMWLGSRWRAPLAILAGVLLVAIALISYRQFAPFGAQPGVVAERAAAADPASAISIAVLPFLNLSGDAGQEFFSDGMTEEITLALAMVPDLKVVARSSAFQFKGEKNDLRAVGQALNATHLIEGSVRKDGNRVRISAQLIEAGKGTHLWTESYDRELKDIFATQEEIAQAIAGALKVPLGLSQGDALVRNRTNDLELYDGYLRARGLYRARNIDEAIKVLEPALARDPGFAPAWALLARAYNLLPNYSTVLRRDPIEQARRSIQSFQAKAETAAHEAIRLDTRYVGGHSALADMSTLRGNWQEAEDLFREALSLDPTDPDTLARYAVFLTDTGRLKESLAVAERLRALEPFVPIYNYNAALIMQLNGQDQESIAVLQSLPFGGIQGDAWTARAYAASGRYGEAADILLAITASQVSRRSVEDAVRLLRTAPVKTSSPQTLPVLEGELGLVYAFVGALDRVMDFPERAAEINFLGSVALSALWYPAHAPLRKSERFKTLVRKIGLVDYWRARGWPEFCRPMADDDFVCV